MSWEIVVLIIGIIVGIIGFLSNITSIFGYFRKYERIEVTSFAQLSIAPNFKTESDGFLQTIEFNPIFQLTNPTNESMIINDFAFSIKNNIGFKMATYKNPRIESSDNVSNFSSFVGDKSKIQYLTYPIQIAPHSNVFLRVYFEIIFYDSKDKVAEFTNGEEFMNQFIGVLFGMPENETHVMRIPHSLSIIRGRKELVYNLEQVIPIIGKAIDLKTVLEQINDPQRVNIIKKVK
jgi:hypothetical protein